MVALLVLLLTLAAIAATHVIDTLIEWSVHKEMVKMSCSTWDYADFNKFKAEFIKAKFLAGWERESSFPKSFFSYSIGCKIHAGIIQFNGRGMILGYFSYLRFLNFESRYMLKTERPETDGR